MKNLELYEKIELPAGVREKLNAYEKGKTFVIPVELRDRILCRGTWEEAIKELQGALEPDEDGMKILWELLNIVCGYTYGEYVQRNIPEDVFIATMKFCTRFLEEHYERYGVYKFSSAWWFPRQMSLLEYRVGALEYEFIDGEQREISLHIPADADLRSPSVLKSIEEFRGFMELYYPEWKNVRMVCETWMLAPAMEELLSEGSNVLAFKHLFELEEIDEAATWFMGWIYPGYEEIDENLPEKTSLQRRMKAHLLEGKKVGVAKGYLK